MRKYNCKFSTSNNHKNKNTDFIIAQYNVLSNEFVNALHGAQTVITINLAVSIGVLAILASILTELYSNPTNCILYVASSLCSSIGLLGTVCCIGTIHISRKNIIKLESKIQHIEKKYCICSVHRIKYFKPLHITLYAFWTFSFIFNVILSISLLCMFNSCFQSVIIPINCVSIVFTFLVLALLILALNSISDRVYNHLNKNLTNTSNNHI